MEKVGDWIRINIMVGEPHYTNRVGRITHIDDIGQLHGTWGGLAVSPWDDDYEIIEDPLHRAANKATTVDDFYHVYETDSGDKIYIRKRKD